MSPGNLLALLISNILPIVCAVSAFFLAYNGSAGWGWFLFIAVLSISGVRISTTHGETK